MSSQRDVRLYLQDMREYAERGLRLASGKTVEEFVAASTLTAAVERYLMIVGEAAVHVRRLRPDLEPRIRQMREMIAFRNVLVHSYIDVSAKILWTSIEIDLKNVIEDVDSILANF